MVECRTRCKRSGRVAGPLDAGSFRRHAWPRPPRFRRARRRLRALDGSAAGLGRSPAHRDSPGSSTPIRFTESARDFTDQRGDREIPRTRSEWLVGRFGACTGLRGDLEGSPRKEPCEAQGPPPVRAIPLERTSGAGHPSDSPASALQPRLPNARRVRIRCPVPRASRAGCVSAAATQDTRWAAARMRPARPPQASLQREVKPPTSDCSITSERVGSASGGSVLYIDGP